MTKMTTALVAGVLLLAPMAAAPAASAAPKAPTSDAGYSAPSDMGTTQAIRKAKSYLRVMAFSRSGLIEQLEYDGFTTSQSTRAVYSLRVSWRKQAAKKAKSYLDIMAFSRSGLYEQLRYDGFTRSQASYGVRAVGL